MRIHIVIPNYNGSQLIKKNLPAVIESTHQYPGTQITIVDDSSSSSEYTLLEEYITSHHKNINLLRNTHNRGFAYTVNKGVFSQDSDVVVLLNSDVAPHKNFLSHPLTLLAQDEKLFGVGCMDESIEGEKRVLRGRGVGSFYQGFLMHKKGSIERENTLWISGGSSIIRYEAYKKLGGFDELYSPFYWEDIDLSYRALKSGYTLLFDKLSVVEHRHEEGAIKTQFSKTQVQQIAYRNQYIFVWKNITDPFLIISHISFLPIHLLRSVLRGDMSMVAGFLKALILFPSIYRSRKKSGKMFSLSDTQILGQFSE